MATRRRKNVTELELATFILRTLMAAEHGLNRTQLRVRTDT